MGIINRGIRNAFRNSIRTLSISFILAVSIGLALIMLLSLRAVSQKIDSVKSSIGNTITVSPAGVRGFEGGGELLTDTDASTIAAISHVVKTTESLNDRLTPSQDTSLVASMDAGSFGKRQQSRNGGVGENGGTPRNFTMPITINGTNDLTNTQALNVNSLNITEGATFDATQDTNSALLGTDLAAKNNLKAGATFKAYGADVTVSGIFDGGNKFVNSSAIMPIKAIQRLSSQAGQTSSVIIQTDSIDNLSVVQDTIKQKLGDKVDVVSSQDTSAQAVKPLENIKTISYYGLIGSLTAGSIIIFLTMIMIVRERRREIGVLKAIGASNLKITLQFVVESMSLTLMGSILGIIGGFVFSNPVLQALVVNGSATAANNGGGAGQGDRGMMARLGGALPGMQNSLNGIHAIVGYDVILYGLLAALVIAIIGSSIPAYFISKIRPSEAMRSE